MSYWTNVESPKGNFSFKSKTRKQAQDFAKTINLIGTSKAWTSTKRQYQRNYLSKEYEKLQ